MLSALVVLRRLQLYVRCSRDFSYAQFSTHPSHICYTSHITTHARSRRTTRNRINSPSTSTCVSRQRSAGALKTCTSHGSQLSPTSFCAWCARCPCPSYISVKRHRTRLNNRSIGTLAPDGGRLDCSGGGARGTSNSLRTRRPKGRPHTRIQCIICIRHMCTLTRAQRLRPANSRR